jgi:hypothetical protein
MSRFQSARLVLAPMGATFQTNLERPCAHRGAAPCPPYVFIVGQAYDTVLAVCCSYTEPIRGHERP